MPSIFDIQSISIFILVISTSKRQTVIGYAYMSLLQLEVERLRKSLEICKKTVQEKSIEIEHKNKLINKLIEDKTRIESTQDIVEDDIDIDNLLHANLGEVDINDILNFNDSVFPDDLDNLDITNLMPDQSLCLSPTSLNMATNTSYVVEEQLVQIPNREGSLEEESVEVKGVVGRMVEQRKSFLSTPQEKINCKKVSPIKILRGGNKYQLVSKKRSAADTPPEVPPCKLPKSAGKVVPTAPQCLSCPHCNKKFPLGGQWALTRHISSVHGSSNTTYSCQYCDKEFSYQSVLIAHMKWHEMTNPWQCGKCDYKLDSLEKFVKHVKRVHVVKNLAIAKTMLVSNSSEKFV